MTQSAENTQTLDIQRILWPGNITDHRMESRFYSAATLDWQSLCLEELLSVCQQ